MKRLGRIVVFGTVVLFIVAGFSHSQTTPFLKVSSNQFDTDGPLGPEPAHPSEITFGYQSTDATDGSEPLWVKGERFTKNTTIDAQTITLLCNGADNVGITHEAATIGDGGGFTYTSLTLNYDDITVALTNAAPAFWVWCELTIPVNGGFTWIYPDAIRLDRVIPDINTAGNFYLYPLTQAPGGKVCINWYFDDPVYTPIDVDGPNGTDSNSNKTTHRVKFMFHKRDFDTPGYASQTTFIESTEEQRGAFCGTTSLTSLDRDDPSNVGFCFKARVKDTAGNYSGFSPDTTGEKCVVLDGKAPSIKKVEYYLDSGFTQPFPLSSSGDEQITTNACYINGTCDTGVDRFAYLKITTSEPLFDGQGPWGYTRRADDGFDNDNDTLIDEEAGGFDNLDNDGDSAGLPDPGFFFDEDVSMAGCVPDIPGMVVNDNIDNDCDGYVDEEGDNLKDDDTCHHENGADKNCRNDPVTDNIDEDITYRVPDVCNEKELFNHALFQTDYAGSLCVKSPTIAIGGADGDPEGYIPLYVDWGNNKDMLKWICTNGYTAGPSMCDGLNTGESIYRVVWNITGPSGDPGLCENGEFCEYDVKFTVTDSVGNEAADVVPDEGETVSVDNAPPTVTVSFKSNSTYSQSFIPVDHDNDGGAVTPNMPIAPEGNVYVLISFDEYVGATPTVGLYRPNSTTPPYAGVPQLNDLLDITPYTTCGQNVLCDPCTGTNCIGYATSTNPCSTFHACFTAASDTFNDGYASIGVYAKDLLENSAWDPRWPGADPDAHAKANQTEWQPGGDQKHDDTDTTDPGGPDTGDGYATYIGPHAADPLDNEPDAQVQGNQFIAFDFQPPDPPAASLPIVPCNGDVVRLGSTCDPGNPTSNSPTIKWTPLSNLVDDDGDGSTDEEIVDGINDDPLSDNVIDEDATGTTQAWMVRLWHIQIATEDTFAPSSIIVESTAVTGTSYSPGMLPERTATDPYYWRISAIDFAGNEGDFSPTIPDPYWTFAVDTTEPVLEVSYYSDATRSLPLSTNPSGIPITGDTADAGEYVYITISSDEPIGSTPTFKIQQNSQVILGPITTTATSTTEYYGQFEVDALGADKVFSDGEAEILISTSDLYGNSLTDQLPASGSMFYVDAEPPVVMQSDIAAIPNPASRDNDGDWTLDELVEDAVRITVYASEKLLNPYFLPATELKVRVVQPGIPTLDVLDDKLDNDCDGLIDEETTNGADDDGDTQIDEDEGTAGAQPGSGCLVTVVWDGGIGADYTGYYNVVPGYDGTTQIIVGDTDPNSKYYVTDYAGNPVFASNTFTVDTQPPMSVTLLMPLDDSFISNTTPQFSWRVTRESGLDKYLIQIAADQNANGTPEESEFDDAVVYATAVISDDGLSTDFYYLHNDGLVDSPDPYHWRVFSIDTARNKSATGSVFSFTVDTTAPDPPEFALGSGETTPTTKSAVKLTGKSKEPDSFIKVYVNDLYVGMMQSDSTGDGNFTVSIDDDGDGSFNEDPVNGVDDDEDGLLDEDPEGIFLQEGKNSVAGQVIDSAGNTGSRGCDANTPFYDADDQKCYIVRDSGYPTFVISYFQDTNLTVPLPQSCSDPEVPSTCLSVAKAGTIYMKITASEELGDPGAPREPTFSISHQGSESVTDQPTASIDGSLTAFMGSYTVNTADGATYVDGNATVYVVGTDNQDNTTPSDTVPSTGGYFTIDTTAPTFSILYFGDENFLEPLPKDTTLMPNAKAGGVYMLVRANEQCESEPVITVDQPGSVDLSATSTAIDSSGIYFKYKYTVQQADGSSYIDGLADVTVTASDIGGNLGSGVTPTSGDQFEIDTTAPAVPTLVPDTTETLFTQIEASGEAEAFAKVEVFTRLNKAMEAGDEVDNDGDGRIDEEPNGSDGVDNDNDFFIDEDTTSNTCDPGEYWAYSESACYDTPLFEPDPDGVAYATASGDFEVTITGIQIGENLVYARAIDTAGNASNLLDFTPVVINNTAPENVTLSHEFQAGWNLVAIPFQPVIATPETGLNLSGYDIFRLQDGIYAYGYDVEGMAPGMCYWIYFESATTVSSSGLTSTTLSVLLDEGWNMIGLPYDKSITWDANVSVKESGSTYSLGTAEADLIVSSTIYPFDPATNAYVEKTLASATTLEPWVGFLIKALKDCELIFPE